MKTSQQRPQVPSFDYKFLASSDRNPFSFVASSPGPSPPLPFVASTTGNSAMDEHKRHLAFVDVTSASKQCGDQTESGEIENATLFSTTIRQQMTKNLSSSRSIFQAAGLFPQYGLLGYRRGTFRDGSYVGATSKTEDNMVYANMNAPWSTFICGSQGGGKSHTLSCLLENCLLSAAPVGQLPHPLAGIVFHYDKFTSMATTQLCEAAYLCSTGVPVRVLVSPSNFYSMQRLYSKLPGLTPNGKKPKVVPMYFKERQLNTPNILTLMSVNDTGNSKPLYLEVLCQILRDMATHRPDRPGIDYHELKQHLDSAAFTRDQNGPLKMRLQLLESFLDLKNNLDERGGSSSSSTLWDFEPGSLTIVDLSDPFVNADDACALFSICLSLFMEQRGKTGRVIALDEAHKFLTQSGEALNFTENLESVIRQQRHLATRVLIATQEPTLAPSLIDLCDVTIVHRFRSPAWFETLKKHLSGTGLVGNYSSSSSDGRGNHLSEASNVFRTIVGLQTGEALLFSPAAVLDLSDHDPSRPPHPEKLNDSYIRIQIRNRVSKDGGKSIMASNAASASALAPSSTSTLAYRNPSSRSSTTTPFPPQSNTAQRLATSNSGQAFPSPPIFASNSTSQGKGIVGNNRSVDDDNSDEDDDSEDDSEVSSIVIAQPSASRFDRPPPSNRGRGQGKVRGRGRGRGHAGT